MSPRASFVGADDYVPADHDLVALRAAADACRGCDLWERATQTVFGTGVQTARVMLVGEQPGDVEDTRGEPFVGPAGAILTRSLADAGLDDIPRYTTNAVKHFRWKAADRGKRRIHEKPSAAQSRACRPWLAAEIGAVRPTVLVALGATAAGSLFGSGFRLGEHRGRRLDWPPDRGDFANDETPVDAAFVTIHPSAVLRAPDDERAAALAGLVQDLTDVRRYLDARS